jgi:hypothetical protein
MNITTGLGSDAAFALVAGRLSPCSPRSLLPTPTTACWLGARCSGDALWSTALGRRRRPRSRTPIEYPIPPPSAAGRAAWTAPNRRPPSDAKRSPAWPIGWGAALRPVPRLHHYPG